MHRIFTVLALLLIWNYRVHAEVQLTSAEQGSMSILIDGRFVAEYVYNDAQIPRPYFASVHAPDGAQITRTQPPDPKTDVADHPLFHPGIWLSFGDLSGSDYWRLAAKTKFIEFARPPKSSGDNGEFAAKFQYLSQTDPDASVCEELFRCMIFELATGTLITWDSTFTSGTEFTFGDQEEMGLGIRMATPLRSERQPRGDIPAGSGTILDAKGRRNGAEVWGQTAKWCDYSGTIDGKQVGAAILCHPDNFRPSWFHARDYGLLVANPFGRQAFKQGDASRVVVKAGQKFRLRYGIFLHSGATPEVDRAYQHYVSVTAMPDGDPQSP